MLLREAWQWSVDDEAAKKLKKRLKTTLYNERPTSLASVHDHQDVGEKSAPNRPTLIPTAPSPTP